jgi:predicted DNA-binding protein (MmcQ/YjbR family)
MNIEDFRLYCLKKKEVTESFPFDDSTLVLKVAGKIFALASLDQPLSINLKCDPEKAVQLRESYHAVKPGYHMNKQHWNTIEIDGTISENTLKTWIDHSYELVISKMPKFRQKELGK